MYGHYIIIYKRQKRSNKMRPSQYINYPFLPYPYYFFYPHYGSQLNSQCCLNSRVNCTLSKHQHFQRPQFIPNKRSQSEQGIKNACKQSNIMQTNEAAKRQAKIQENPDAKQVKIEVNTHYSQNKDYQKEGRNANSNLLRMFFRKLELSLISKSSNVPHIIARHKLKITVNAFEEWFQIHKAEHRKYIRLPTARNLFSSGGKRQKQEHKIMRVLLLQFLSKQAHIHFLTSKKIKKTNTKFQMQSCQNIISQLF